MYVWSFKTAKINKYFYKIKLQKIQTKHETLKFKGGNVYMLELWKGKSPPYMQLVHFMFGFGACIAPLIAEPFIKSNTHQANSMFSALEHSPAGNMSTYVSFNRTDVTSLMFYLSLLIMITKYFTQTLFTNLNSICLNCFWSLPII